MKQYNLKVLVSVCICIYSTLFVHAQQNYWTMPPYKIDLTGATPSITNLTGFTTTPHKASNGAYDENGNLLFTIDDGNIYYPNGTLFNSAVGYTNVGHEIAIVPVPGSCKSFYIISNVLDFSTAKLHYSILNCTNSTYTITYPTYTTPLSSDGYSAGIAVSKIIGTTNTRYLYCVSYSSIKKFTISSTGIVLSSSFPSYSYNYRPSEVELSNDGTRLVFGSANNTFGDGNKLYEFPLNPNGDNNVPPFVTTLPSPITAVYGIEIHPTIGKAFICTNNGLYWKTLGNTSAPTAITSSAIYNYSFIEMAKNGKMYVVSNTGKLGEINITANTVAASANTTTMYCNAALSPSSPLGGNPYLLPDQIDGENYNYFFGVAQATPSFKINNTTVNCATSTLFYNCNAITLNNNSTGATQYQITITPTNSAGTAIGGAIYNSAWLTTCPTDLKNLPGTNGAWLASNTGYFKIAVLEKNSCNVQSASYCIFVQIATTPGPTENLTIYGKNSTNYNPSQNIASPILVGCYSLGMSIGTGGLGTTNNITGYQYKIEEVNCSTGAVLSTLYNGPTVAVTTSGAIPTINFNQATINGNTGYFGQNCATLIGKCYKLTLVVSNPCGTATDWTYFKIDNPPYYRTANPNVKTDEVITKNNFSIAPNPFVNQFNIQYYLDENNKVNVQLFDFTGKEVLNLSNDTWNEKGNHSIEINTNDLPKGMYIYRIQADEVRTGKIIKAD